MYRRILLIFQISTIALLLGRGWQFIFKSTPFNSFFFHSVIMNPVVKNIYKTDWKEYLTNPAWNESYDFFISGLGIYLWLSILVVVWIQKLPRRIVVINLWSVFFILIFLSFCYFLERGFQIGQFIEFSLQFCSPLFLWFWLLYLSDSLSPDNEQRQLLGDHKQLKIATALTFIGHGLYAINFHPRPGYFIDMIIKAFYVSESMAVLFLNVVGYLDIICATALFIPYQWIQKMALYYIIAWGFLTALARFYANVQWELGWYSIKQWLPEFLMRFPHFLIPFILLMLVSQKSKHVSSHA